ncbi:hypothetical protein LEP3755_52830 [Leptolyngbya sp. NIES-3755]|nr:hypothetical protein LEP3755_52830 [Leptolyngbya sp. NIES-3755]
MRNIFAIAVFTGFGWLGFSSSLQAATLIQDFEIVVDRITLPPGETVPPPSVPPLGTRGQGRLTFDTNQIQFGQISPFYEPRFVGYFTRQPTSVSIDFFGNRYTNLPVVRGPSPRDTPLFIFSRTEAGSYQLSSSDFGTFNPDGTGLGITGVAGSNPGYFVYLGAEDRVDGSVTFTRSEVIPEPTTIAGVPVAIALSWACHRRFKRRRIR